MFMHGDAVPFFFVAALEGHIEQVRNGIQRDASLVTLIDGDGCTALIYAAANDSTDIVEYLVHHGADVNHRSTQGATALHVACNQGHVNTTSVLLRRGARATLQNGEGSSPLMEAAYNGHGGVVGVLLDHGSSNLDARDVHGATALFFACTKDHPEVVWQTLEAGADPTVATANGISPIEVAEHHQHDQCVRHLEESERAYGLTKARQLHDASFLDVGAHSLTAYMQNRVVGGSVGLPSVVVAAGERRADADEEVGSLDAPSEGNLCMSSTALGYLIEEMDKELFVELSMWLGLTDV